MNVLLLIALLFAADDSTLVKAAKANGGLKKPIPKKTITNKDVKESKGKIKELPPGSVGAAAPGSASAPEAGAPTLTVAQFEAKKKAIAAAEKRVADAESNAADLEKELNRVEQSYYEAADPTYRDTVIAARFTQAKKQLDVGRQQLADARDALAKLNPTPPATQQPQ